MHGVSSRNVVNACHAWSYTFVLAMPCWHLVSAMLLDGLRVMRVVIATNILAIIAIAAGGSEGDSLCAAGCGYSS